MDYAWVGVERIPPCTSVVPVERENFINDMELVGEKLTKQVIDDVPRSKVILHDENTFSVRIHSGAILEDFVRRLIRNKHIEDAVLALSTQTVMALPVRSLSECLHEKNLFVGECEARQPLTIRINASSSKAQVHAEKQLCVLRPTDRGTERLQRIKIVVDYDSEEPYVLVKLKRK
jgi:hypothetical protein